MLRGRRSCTTSVRPGYLSQTQTTRSTADFFVLSSLFRILSPTIPVHRRHSPVSPIIPVHTQKQGGGGCSKQNARANNSFVFSRHVNYILNYMSYYIVGAPTFSFRPATQNPPGRTERASEGGRYKGMRKTRTSLKAGHYKGDQDGCGFIRSGGLRRGRAWKLSWRATRRRSGRWLR